MPGSKTGAKMTRFHAAAVKPAILILGLMSVPGRADHPGYVGRAGTSGPIVTIPASTLPKGKLAAGVRVTYARPERLSDDELAGRAGEHIHAHAADYVLSPSLGLAYGVTERFTLALSLPFVHRDDLRAGSHSHSGGVAHNGVDRLGSSSGVGDAILLGQFRLTPDHHAPWQAALLAGVKLPTGATHVRDRDGDRFETEHQPGTGSLDPLLGLAVTRRFDRVSLDANALYHFSRRGAQDTRLGDRAQYNLSLAYRLGGEAPHEHGEHDHAPGTPPHEHVPPPQSTAVDLVLELNGEWEGRQRESGVIEAESGGHTLYLSPGVRVTPSPRWSASLSLGLPVVQRIRLSHPENGFRLVAGLGWAF
jgi:hypothetical protein